jgi:hypothetical protein
MRVIASLISILVLLSVSGCERQDYTYTNGDVSVAYLWSIAKEHSTPIREDIVLRGYVVANDIVGELSRSFVFSDGSGGIEVKVDASNIESILPFSYAISIHCSGLYVGREGGRLVLGTKPTDIYTVDRIAEEDLFNYVTIIEDDVEPLRAEATTIADIGYDDMFRYVMLQNIYFVEEERGMCWCDIDPDSGKRIATLRHLTDGRDTIPVITAPTALYSAEHLPQYRVRCIGIVDIYKEMVTLRLSNHQISPM